MLVLVVIPVRGRSATGWLLATLAYAAGVVLRWTRWRSHARQGEACRDGSTSRTCPGCWPGSGCMTGRRPGRRTPGSRSSRTTLPARVWAATAAISHPGLALADAAERDSQGRGLTALLNACARTELISEVLFLIRSVPDDGAEREQWLASHQPATAPVLARQVNAEMAATLTLAGVRTEAFCTIVVPEARLAREAKEFGRGVDARARAMTMLMSEVETHLRTGMRAAAWTG